jgi:hypothetical protein
MEILDLWLPILLSAVFVFVVSSVVHMVLPIHKGDYKKLPGEAGILEAMRAQGVQPDEYMFPCASSMKDMCTPEMIEKFKQGPVGIMTVMPSGPPRMGKCLVLWFLYLIVVGVFVGYITGLALGAGAEYKRVFRVAGTVAILAYAVGNLPATIWKGQKWSTTCKFIFEGVVYGLVTAGTFGWLWPDAA